jgi:hypothetical protein
MGRSGEECESEDSYMGEIESIGTRGKGNEIKGSGDGIVRIAVASKTLRFTCSGTL